MVKSKFGDKLKSKNLIAQKNELLCTLIAHNIVVLIYEMHEFWTAFYTRAKNAVPINF